MAYDVTNTSLGFRFLGAFGIEAGETRLAVELSDDEVLGLGELDGVTVTEIKAKKATVKETAPDA